MIESMFGPEGSLIVRFVVAFLIVLGLIGLTFWLIRRFGGTRVSAAQQRGRQPRLAVVDAAPVDGRRRLVLIRRDNVEHLVMIGGPADIVVEQNILRAVPVTAPREMPVPRTPGAVEAASATRALPPDEPQWTPEPPPPAPRVPEPRPSFARPDPLGRLRPAEAPVARPTLGRPLPPPELPPIAPEPSLDEPRPAAAPASADAALASMAQRLEAALRRPATPAEPAKPETSTERPAPVSLDPPDTESPSTAPNGNGGRSEQKPSKAKSTLDSLEAEMASLLGRPPGKE